MSKIENCTKQISRSWLPIPAEMCSTEIAELEILWVVDKLVGVLKEERFKAVALEQAKLQLKLK